MTVADAFNEEILKMSLEQELAIRQIRDDALVMKHEDLVDWLCKLAVLWYQQQNALKFLMRQEVDNDFSRIGEGRVRPGDNQD